VGERVVVVRHGNALARAAWSLPDTERPLSLRGKHQAEALGEALMSLAPLLVLASPARRCQDTLSPLARRAGLPLVTEPLLAEGTPPEAALGELLRALERTPPRGGRPGPPSPGEAPAGRTVVGCTHGDVVDGIVSLLAGRGVPCYLTAWELASPGELATSRERQMTASSRAVSETPKAGRWELEIREGAVHAAVLVMAPDWER